MTVDLAVPLQPLVATSSNMLPIPAPTRDIVPAKPADIEACRALIAQDAIQPARGVSRALQRIGQGIEATGLTTDAGAARASVAGAAAGLISCVTGTAICVLGTGPETLLIGLLAPMGLMAGMLGGMATGPAARGLRRLAFWSTEKTRAVVPAPQALAREIARYEASSGLERQLRGRALIAWFKTFDRAETLSPQQHAELSAIADTCDSADPALVTRWSERISDARSGELRGLDTALDNLSDDDRPGVARLLEHVVYDDPKTTAAWRYAKRNALFAQLRDAQKAPLLLEARGA